MSKILLFAFAFAALLTSCRPDPIDIDVPQRPGQLAISSACIGDSAVYVSASYSVNSLRNMMDTTSSNQQPIPRDMVVDSGLVTISSPGAAPDTLRCIRPGLYGRSGLSLMAGTSYTMRVLDYRKGTSAIATTTYMPRPDIDTIIPVCSRVINDSVVKLQMRLPEVAPGSYYVVSYNTLRNARESVGSLPLNASAFYNFSPKQVELFSTGSYDHGTLDKTVTLEVKTTDTIIIQIGRIERAYFDYLSAYKRTGALINQLTGEPINLPNNVQPGFGYFSLYQPILRVYDLNKF